MTHTLLKRTKWTPYAADPPGENLGILAPVPEPLSETTELAASLRSLALRAHCLSKAGSAEESTPRAKELTELRSEAIRLQDRMGEQGSEAMAAYVTALRREIEARLA